MEIALNLGWFALSGALLAIGLFHRDKLRSPWGAGIALLCIACLLFPVISMTDDLNSAPALFENNKLKKLFSVLEFAVPLHLHASVKTAPDTSGAVLSALSPKPAQPQPLFFDLSRRPPPLASF